MIRGTTGVPEEVLLESNGISRDLTPSGLKTPAAPALKCRRSHEICQDLTDSRRDHNPCVGGSSPSSATNDRPKTSKDVLPASDHADISGIFIHIDPWKREAPSRWPSDLDNRAERSSGTQLRLAGPNVI